MILNYLRFTFVILACLVLVSCWSTLANLDKCDPAAEIESRKLENFSKVGAARWNDYLENINQVSAQEYDFNKLTITQFADIPGQNKFHGGVLAADGSIYFIPSFSSLIYYFNPADGILKTIEVPGFVEQSWSGGVLGANGKIYALPSTTVDPSILEIDVELKTTRKIDVFFGGYGGQILAPNGKIYGIPDNANSIMEFDPVTDIVNYIGVTDGSLDGARKYFGGVLAPNGNIYGIPLDATNVLKFNPGTKEISYFGTLPAIRLKWAGGVLAPNGKIYAVPDDASQILVINSNDDTVELIGQLGMEAQKWSFGFFAPNGLVYFVPDDGQDFIELDWRDNSIRRFGGPFVEKDQWNGAVMALNGKAYTVPDSSPDILEIDFCLASTFDKDLLLSTYFNKY